MGRLESAIQTDIVRYLRGRGDTYVLNYGGSASGAKGTPDLIVCHRGLFYGLEVKKPHGSYGLTSPQRMRLRQIRKAGGVGAVVTSVADVVRLLDRIEEGHVIPHQEG